MTSEATPTAAETAAFRAAIEADRMTHAEARGRAAPAGCEEAFEAMTALQNRVLDLFEAMAEEGVHPVSILSVAGMALGACAGRYARNDISAWLSACQGMSRAFNHSFHDEEQAAKETRQ